MDKKEINSTKFCGIQIWPINHLWGFSKLRKPTTESVKKLKPEYKVTGLHGSLTDVINGLARVLPFMVIAWISTLFYSVE